MCKLNQGFKLCNCDEAELSDQEIDWQLERFNQKLPIEYRKGKAAIPRYSEEEHTQIQTITNELNQANCFDFEYEANENDRLSLRVKDKYYAFRFQKGQWQLDKSTSLDTWRSQLEKYKKGKIE